jgi:hypothetical protein
MANRGTPKQGSAGSKCLFAARRNTRAHALFYLRANLRKGVSLCGRKCFWLWLLLVSWLVPPFPFKRPRQMLLGVAAIRPPRQGTLAITRRVGRSSAGARVNGSCTKLPIGVAPRRRPNLSRKAGDPRPPRIPFHLASHRVVCDVMANGTGLPRPCTHKSRLVRSGWSISALPPKADIRECIQYVYFVPLADSRARSRYCCIT